MQRRAVCVLCLLGSLFVAGVVSSSPLQQGVADRAGSLRATAPNGTERGECPLQHTNVRAKISGHLSRVTVTQTFHNPYTDPIEAVYTFPLPHDAAVDDMTIRIGGRTIRGVMKRREEARADYETARATGRTAALLDQERPNVFTQHVANILPGHQIEIEIRYVETLRLANGSYSFVFPTVVGPRYIPGSPVGRQAGGWSPDTTRVPDASRLTPPVAAEGTRAGHDLSIEVDLETGLRLSNLRSIQHEVIVQQSGAGSAQVRLLDQAVIPNKDFVLEWDVGADELQDGFLAHRAGPDGYFMLVLQPPTRVAAADITPKEIVFVLDTSGSMRGLPIETARDTMQRMLSALYPQDTFNLITFSGDTRILFPHPLPATPGNIVRAQEMLDAASGSGGTEMMRAIRAALEPSDSQQHVRVVCFMTDGFVGNDMEIISEIQKHPNARIFSFGIGSSTNRFLLEQMAAQGRGAAEFVTLDDDTEAAARRFDERVRSPLLTDITIDWGGAPVSDVLPGRIRDLFGSEPVVVCGRYRHKTTASVRLRGRMAGREVVRVLRLSLPEREAEHGVLATLWARQRIGELMAHDYAGIQRNSPRADIRDAITDLGIEHRIMTPFTSFVAVEEKAVTDGGRTRTIQVPVEMPAGVSHQGVFGTAATAPVRVGGNIAPLKLLRRVEPVYSDIARRTRLDSVVIVEVVVGEKGAVHDARVLRGHPLLVEAVVLAVKQWTYEPVRLNAVPVPVIATVAVEFRALPGANLDPAVALLLHRVGKGLLPDAGDADFVREGVAELHVTLAECTSEVLGDLKAAGLVLLEQPESRVVTGRIRPEQIDALSRIRQVNLIAPRRGGAGQKMSGVPRDAKPHGEPLG